MQLPIYQIDAFTDEQFKGNPAAVIPLEKWLDENTMQKIAAENNLSETAFFVKKDDDYELRWFTPTEEVNLCGHATLATAFVINHYVDKQKNQMKFHTKSGLLEVNVTNDLFTLTFPAIVGEKIACPEELVNGLGMRPKEVYKADDYLAVFDREEDIERMKPSFVEIKKLNSRGVIVTARGVEADFVSRFFAPQIGIEEDPVTGSAHCMLIPYWQNQYQKDEFVALQLSKRGGRLYCKSIGEKVEIAGKAVVYLEGYIYV